MLSAIKVCTLKAQPTLVIKATTTMEEYGAVLAQILPEVWQFAVARSIEPSGPPFARFLAFHPDDTGELEAGIPIPSTIAGEGSVEASELPAGEAAMVVYTGPYDQIGEAHMALGAWVRENRRETAGPSWESYITDPGSEPDSAKWQTEVYWPIR